MNKQELKQALAGLTHANIAVRNFPLSVTQLRNKLKLKDGGHTYLFATTMRKAGTSSYAPRNNKAPSDEGASSRSETEREQV